MSDDQLKNSELPLRGKLIETAEKLYAVHGFDAVSFRRICNEAGARNNYAIQYHFGNIENLASAILTHRTLSYEVERGRRLTLATNSDSLDTRCVLEILTQPIIALVDDKGVRLGAKFMVALQNTAWGWKPLSRQMDCSPVAQQLVNLLCKFQPELPLEVIWQRLYQLTLMILNCATQIPENLNKDAAEAIMDNAFSMASAAMQAPILVTTQNAMQDMYRHDIKLN